MSNNKTIFTYFRLDSSLFLFSFLAVFVSTNSFASTLSGALGSRGAFVFPSGLPNTSSYDGPGRDTMSLFSSLTNPGLFQVNSFNSHSSGSTVQAFLLSEMAAFDGTHAGFANNFGVTDQNGNFHSLINTATADPLASGSIEQSTLQNFTFALQSPEGLFYSVDSKNTDGGVAHMLALQVEKDGVVNLPNTTLKGGNPLSFNLLAGDVVLFIEDMKLSGNISNGLVPFASDFDYNDMVIVVRQTFRTTEVPEPTTLALLAGSGLFAAARRRKLSK